MFTNYFITSKQTQETHKVPTCLGNKCKTLVKLVVSKLYTNDKIPTSENCGIMYATDKQKSGVMMWTFLNQTPPLDVSPKATTPIL